MEVTL
jgi:hypothetical protein